jgi:Fe-S-cluster-containing dehydrogenase component/formate-dependent nitrite reductase membrane component NrfD
MFDEERFRRYATAAVSTGEPERMNSSSESVVAKWAKVIDHTRCIGCHACTTACKSENLVPLSVTRTYVKYVDIGEFPQTRRAFQVTRCNQCDDAPCTHACPTRAMFRRPDGIVDFDKSICIGCKACIAACPYDAIFINPDDHSAEKCNFCAHRIDAGLEPACVVVCPTEAILVGDLHDPLSKVAQLVHRDVVNVRRPEKETHPKLFYKGAHQATLDPLAARRPDGGLFLWSEQPGAGSPGSAQVVSGHPRAWNNAASAVLSYDVAHSIPWDWRVSLYTWTKAIAAGSYIAAFVLALTGVIAWSSPLWLTITPLLGILFLALTGALLIWDLEHPERFYMIFTRPHWRSWLVRGGFIIAAYGALLALHLITGIFGIALLPRVLAWIGLPLAAATAVYTAYLFAQSKARDLWQNPLLVPLMLVQALLAGATTLLPFASSFGEIALSPLLWLVAGATLAHLLFIFFELTMVHGTAHARLAAWEMTRGGYAAFFWLGTIALSLGITAPWLGIYAALPALLGMLLYEHAYVQAAQAVPLA